MKTVWLWLVLVASCAKEAPPAHVTLAAGSDAGTPIAPAVAAAPPRDAGHVITSAELPPFARGSHADPVRAAELAHQAIRDATVGGDDPMTDAKAAVAADPASAVARYAIACVANDEAFATDQLRLLASGACDDCIDPLRNVLIDTACPWTAAHKAIAARVTPAPQRAAAETIIASLIAVDPRGAKPFFTGAGVTSRFACSNCSDQSHDRKLAGTGGKVLDGIMAAFAKNAGFEIPFVAGDRLLCAHDCCTVDRMLLQHSHVFFDKLCFAPGTTRVRSIDFIDG